MNRFLKISAVFIFCSAIYSCSSYKVASNDGYVIRYVNLNAVYEYVYSSSSEAQNIKKRSEIVIRRIEELENSEPEINRKEFISLRKEQTSLKEREKKLKTEFYSRIKASINNVAAKNNADFILNSGEGVVYSRPMYDLTSDVIKEFRSLSERSSSINK